MTSSQAKVRFALLLTTLTLAATTTRADDTLSQRVQAEAQKLNRIETQLIAQDHDALDYYIRAIDSVIERYRPASNSLICASNGQYGDFEKFTVTDPSTGEKIGGATTLASCKKVISEQNQDLICLSNGQYGDFEKFVPYDFTQKRNIGGATTADTCHTLVSRARIDLMCTSNGQYGDFEKFTLYNRNNQRAIGGGTTLNQCLDSVR